MSLLGEGSRLRLTVGTYNIHGAVGRDGRRDLVRVGQVVSALQADIVALQEVDGANPGGGADDACEVIARATGLTAIRGPTMRRGSGDYGNVVLTRFAPRSVRLVDLTYKQCEPRGALDLDMEIHGARVRVIATHLGLLPTERRHQVRRLIEIVRAGAAGDEAATLLMGDINEWFVHGRPLRWLHACFEGESHDVRTFPARWPLFALDRIWVHPKIALAGYGVHDSGLARVASDHLPVRAEIELGRGGWR